MSLRLTLLGAALAVSSSLAACGSAELPTDAALASAAAADAGQSRDEVRVRIALVAPTVNAPFRRAKGKASFKSRRAQRELELEVEHLRPGTPVDFFVGGVQVGARQAANEFGEANLELNTRLGDSVPTSVTGQPAEARTAAGQVIVSGSF